MAHLVGNVRWRKLEDDAKLLSDLFCLVPGPVIQHKDRPRTRVCGHVFQPRVDEPVAECICTKVSILCVVACVVGDVPHFNVKEPKDRVRISVGQDSIVRNCALASYSPAWQPYDLLVLHTRFALFSEKLEALAAVLE